MKERDNLKKRRARRLGLREMKNRSVPGNIGENKLKNMPTIGKCL